MDSARAQTRHQLLQAGVLLLQGLHLLWPSRELVIGMQKGSTWTSAWQYGQLASWRTAQVPSSSQRQSWRVIFCLLPTIWAQMNGLDGFVPWLWRHSFQAFRSAVTSGSIRHGRTSRPWPRFAEPLPPPRVAFVRFACHVGSIGPT